MANKTILDRVYLQTPRSTERSLLEGGEQVRSCCECDKQVYNLSSMTRRQAEDLITRADGRLCAKFDRDENGKIITADRLARRPAAGIHLPHDF